jgi:hypothetical protein
MKKRESLLFLNYLMNACLEIGMIIEIRDMEANKIEIISTFLWEYKTVHLSQAPVAHICNSSYSGSRDQEDHSLKQPWKIVCEDPISKNPITKNWAGSYGNSQDAPLLMNGSRKCGIYTQWNFMQP